MQHLLLLAMRIDVYPEDIHALVGITLPEHTPVLWPDTKLFIVRERRNHRQVMAPLNQAGSDLAKKSPVRIYVGGKLQDDQKDAH